MSKENNKRFIQVLKRMQARHFKNLDDIRFVVAMNKRSGVKLRDVSPNLGDDFWERRIQEEEGAIKMFDKSIRKLSMAD